MSENSRFKIGDKVEYELATSGQPRWDWSANNGTPSDKFVDAEVIEVNMSKVTTRCLLGNIWSWSTDEECMSQPGYVRLMQQKQQVAICHCDIRDIWNLGNDGHIDECPEKK